MARLKEGMEPPAFKAVTYDGQLVDLDSILGYKKIWLVFYRYAGCPLCQMHIYHVAEKRAELEENNVEFLAVFESEAKDFKPMQGRSYPSLKMIVDPQKNLFNAFGVELSLLKFLHPGVLWGSIRAFLKGMRQGPVTGDLRRIPAHFLILEDGTIHATHYGTHAADHLPWWRVRQFMAIGRERRVIVRP